MPERWLPVLAAVLGLLGGIGGAAVGGYVANKGQEQRFAEQRAARIRDVRLDTYAKFLRAAENEHFNARASDDIITRAEAEVDLMASSDALREAAAMLTDTLLNNEDTPIWERKIRKARKLFVDLAHTEIETGT
jgi:CHASE1-domain containing sensor protein